jgi:hypothetical protein
MQNCAFDLALGASSCCTLDVLRYARILEGRMVSADLNFKTGVVFVGTMSAAGQQARVRFRLKVLPTGALTLKFRRLCLTKRNAWIMRHWDSKQSVVANYTLEAKSGSGAMAIASSSPSSPPWRRDPCRLRFMRRSGRSDRARPCHKFKSFGSPPCAAMLTLTARSIA